MYKVLDYPGARKPLTRLQVGSELAFDIGEHGALHAIRFDRDDDKRVQLSLDGDQVTQTVTAREVQSRVQVASAEITRSLRSEARSVGKECVRTCRSRGSP